MEADTRDGFARIDEALDVLRSDARAHCDALEPLEALRRRVKHHGDTIDAHALQLQDRKHDYDAVLQRLAGIMDRVDTLSDAVRRRNGDHARIEALIADARASRHRIAMLENGIGLAASPAKSLMERLDGQSNAIGALERTVDDMRAALEHAADSARDGDWCPAQTGLIQVPKDGHLMHTCSTTGGHVSHKCSCGYGWISANWPQSDSERADGRLVPGVPDEAVGAPTEPVGGPLAVSVRNARTLAQMMYGFYVMRGYAHPYDAFQMRENLYAIVTLLGGDPDA